MTSDLPRLSLVLALPPDENARLERWTQTAPPATWPSWGGHVTIWPALEPTAGIDVLKPAIEAVVARFDAFEMAMSRVALKPFWGSPGLYTAQLVADEEDAGGAELDALRAGLYQSLSDVAVDLHPETRSNWFEPHVTLTIALDHDAASTVVEAARRDQLNTSFLVRCVDMNESLGDGVYAHAGSFYLASPL
ncbi:MAG TPA: 2'-5' RNA ligase family protein [Dehalococcoidia bacterium]|nr:2'-5' RNA ligase family protein [Dehalococcoidia bacterium]